MKKQKHKKFDLYSNQNLLDALKSNDKNYTKILKALSLLGNFDGKTLVELYDNEETEDLHKIRLWCSDNDENIFIIYGYSTDKDDCLKISKLTSDNEYQYDIKLAKKFELNPSNIELIRNGNIFSFKFGRLITDEKSFYNLFLGDNVSYQLQMDGNEESIEAKDLLVLLNKLETIPTFKNYTDIFAQLLCDKSINYNTMLLGAYKNFESLGTLTINEEKSNVKVLSK